MSYVRNTVSDAAKERFRSNFLGSESSAIAQRDSSSPVLIVTSEMLPWRTVGRIGYSSSEQEFYALGACIQSASNLASAVVAKREPTVSIAEMVDLAKETFGLSVVQIAQILGVSRPSLYNHISGRESPKDTSAYQALYATTLRVRQSVRRSLKPGLKSILIEGKTLLGHLKDAYWDLEAIERYSRLIAEKLEDTHGESHEIPVSEQRKAVLTTGKSG